jgi:hypothetical protein
MMVTSTLIAELEAARTALAAERARIREEYETRLPDIESDLAAVDRLLRHGTGQVVGTAPDVPEVAQGVQAAPEAVQDVPDATVATDAAPIPADAPTDNAAPVEAERSVLMTPSRRPNWRRELDGLHQEPAAVKIAERAGGTVTVSEVALVFMEVGLTRATGKLAKGHVSKVLSESPRFDRLGKSIYRLVGEPAPELGELPTEHPTTGGTGVAEMHCAERIA